MPLPRPVLLLAFTSFLAASASRAQPPIEILSRSLIYEHPNADPYDRQNRYGFNHGPSVTVLPDGRLACAWFSGPFEASVHQVILGSYSSDGGNTWTPAEILQDFPRTSDFDPAFVSTGSQTWLFFSEGRWNRYPFVRDEKQGGVGVDSFQMYFRVTDNSPNTWSPPQAAAIEPGYNCRANGIQLTTGELLLPVYKLAGGPAGVLKSTDRGETWKRFGDVTTAAGQDEPTIAELTSGAVLMVLRTGDGRLWKTLSHDKGETWGAPVKTGLVAARASHNLFRMRDGRIALTHDACPPPHRTPLTLRVSSDDAETWSTPAELASVSIPEEGARVWGRQVTYPSVGQLDDGTLVVVWSKIALGDAEQWGDIWSARVRVR